MNQLLALVPGFAKANMAIRALGITSEEISAADAAIASLQKAPFLRSLPPALLPGNVSQAIQLVVGLSGMSSGIPTWVIGALKLPQVQAMIGSEVERYVMTSEHRDHLLSALGKAAKGVMGEADLDGHKTLAEFVGNAFLPAVIGKIEESRGSNSTTTLHKCRKCGEAQVIHAQSEFSCRFCDAKYLFKESPWT